MKNKVYWNTSMQVVSGISPQQIYDSMMANSRYKDHDIVVVVFACNGVTDLDWSFKQEPQDLAASMRRLCMKMLRAPRALLVAGMSALTSDFDETWDALVEKYVDFCRSLGIVTVTGDEFFCTLVHIGDGTWHFARGVNQDQKIADYDIECVEAIVAGYPTAAVAGLLN